MRVALLVGAFVLGTALFVLSRQDTQAVPGLVAGDTAIVLTDTGFEPREVHIAKGSTVTFSTTRDIPFWPASDPHPSHGMYRGFDPVGPIQPGETWSFTFDTTGEWEFHDHLRSYYTGTVYVSEK